MQEEPPCNPVRPLRAFSLNPLWPCTALITGPLQRARKTLRRALSAAKLKDPISL